jgi:lipoate-protein ligase A
MYCINSDTHNPYFNLALEEHLLKNRAEEFLILSINDISIISGKHQCIHREVNTRFVTENNIPVLRRITGGGTVFHDQGNLNFCFIRNCEAGKQIDFQRHLLPVTVFLSTFGVQATIQGSDLKVDGLKISGNAEHVYRSRVLHHGTLLWNASFDTLHNCIRKETSSYTTRAVPSRPAIVTNLSEKIKRFRHISEFRSGMLNYFLDALNGASLYNLNQKEKAEIEMLAGKYRTWQWNYAYGPEYEFSNEFIIGDKKVRCVLSVKDGIIRDYSIDDPEWSVAWEKLKGCRHMPSDIRQVIKDQDIDPFIFF